MGALKEKATEFAESATAHGIGRVATSKSIWLRVAWAIIVIAAFTYCMVQLYHLLSLYFKRPITIQREVIYEPVEFPAVSFCNLNPVRESKISLGSSIRLDEVLQQFEFSFTSQVTGDRERERIRGKRAVDGRFLENPDQDNMEDGVRIVLQGVETANRNSVDMDVPKSEEREAKEPAMEIPRTGKSRQRRNAMDDTCLRSNQGQEYCGTLNTTRYGRTCQRWDSQSPHRHSYTNHSLFPDAVSDLHEVHNYCRNPSRNPGLFPWCYTTDVNRRFDYCDIPFCAESADSCYEADGLNYEGTHSITESGKTCQRWDSQTPHQHTYTNPEYFPGESLEGAENYCRNPSHNSGLRPWCYTNDTNVRWELCGIPQCSAEVETFDPIDEEYEPVTSVDDLWWFNNTDQLNSELTNSLELISMLYDLPVSLRRNMGHQLNDALQECSWNGILCSPLNFTGFMSRKYGNCYTFNSESQTKILKQTKAGQYFGLSMTLFVEQNEYISSLSTSPGMRVLVHRKDQHPFIDYEGFDIEVGKRTSIRLSKTIYERLGSPFSNCTDGLGFKLHYKKKYSVMACRKTCHQKKIIKKCGCADKTMAVPLNQAVCTMLSETRCMARVHKDFETGQVPCQCPELCNDKKYKQSVYTSYWPSGLMRQIIRENYKNRSEALSEAMRETDGVSKHLLKLDIFYDELKYDDVIEQEEYGLSKLLGDIGGQLGLWIGVSIISILEVVQFLLELFTTCCKRKKGNAVSAEQTGKEAAEDLDLEIEPYAEKPPEQADDLQIENLN